MKVRKSLSVVVCLLSLSLFATESWRNGERVPLWPEGKIPDFQKHQIGAMTDETSTNAEWRAAHQMPYLEWFAPPAKPNGGCMILVSGGSYQCCCDVGLIKMWNTELTKLGFQCVNLVYRTPRPKGLPIYQTAWEDGQRAVRIVRSQARKRGFGEQSIGVIGMSAGGHLVCLLATSSQTPAYEPVDELDKLPCNVNWCIANAPAYNTLQGEKGGQTPKEGITEKPVIGPALKFDKKTCPISFHHGGLDPWTPNGSTLAYLEMRRHGVPAELHLYADRSHGAHGFERAVEFMRGLGFLPKIGSYDQLEIHRQHPDGTLRAEKEYLWPSKKGGFEPYLVWYVPEKPVTKAVQVIFAGGGYGFCNYVQEAEPVAYYLNKKGMAAVCVKYRNGRQPAWQDAQRAIRLVRSEAEGRGLDPNRIGTLGFSAGGHLTLMTALSSCTNAYPAVDAIDKLSCSVQWACPIYPAYSLTDGANGACKNGGNGDEDVVVPEFAFDAGTPPMCFVHGDMDAHSPMASVKVWEKLRSMGIQSDLHTLARRGHCFQVSAAQGTGSYTWLDRIWEFLSAKKFNK